MRQLLKNYYRQIGTSIFAGIFWALRPIFATESNASRALGGLIQTGNEAYGGGQTVSIGPATFNSSLIHLINFLLSFLGIIFFLLMVYAGYLWMNARGNDESVMKAKKIIREAVTAIIIILTARLFTEFLLRSIGEAASG